MDWYYAEGSTQKGPISDSDFQSMVDSGQITAKTLVWNNSMKNWAEYGSVAPAGSPAVPAGQTATCSECHEDFPAGQMVQYEKHFICAKCKPVFFQRIQEGGSIPNSFGVGGTGETPNKDLMAQAREVLAGRWGEGVICVLAFFGINFAIGLLSSLIPILGNLAPLLITGPITVGIYMFFLNLSRGESTSTGILFKYFERFGTCLWAYVLMMLVIYAFALPVVGVMVALAIKFRGDGATMMGVIALCLPLLIPAVIAGMRMSMLFLILGDETEITAYQALKRSSAMMKGSCWKYFCLNCRFIGWMILCFFTLFIGFLWLYPYMMTSYARFYEDVRGKVAGQ